MFFRKKKEKAAECSPSEVQKLLSQALLAQARVENALIGVGTVRGGTLPCAFIKQMGKTLKEDLGERGRAAVWYNAAEKELTLLLTFSYKEGSEEISLVEECLDSFDLDEEDKLPGDVCEIETCYVTSKDVTEIHFTSFGVAKDVLALAADRLLSQVFDWLDVVYESFEEEF